MKNRKTFQTRSHRHRRAFTLAELIIAGVITSFILGSISMCLTTLAKAKTTSRQRLEAHLRADAALTRLRADVASMIRTDDLFYTRFLLYDGSVETPLGHMERDELLVFNNRLRMIRNVEFQGEGTQYETQYRVEEGSYRPSLWARRDHLPDKYPMGGGVATPIVDSILSFSVEAYDGFQWQQDWDSDLQGVPYAVRLTVTAAGDYGADDIYDAPTATLRTVVSLDRILLPSANFAILAALEEAAEAEEQGFDNDDPLAPEGAGGVPDARGNIDLNNLDFSQLTEEQIIELGNAGRAALLNDPGLRDRLGIEIQPPTNSQIQGSTIIGPRPGGVTGNTGNPIQPGGGTPSEVPNRGGGGGPR